MKKSNAIAGRTYEYWGTSKEIAVKGMFKKMMGDATRVQYRSAHTNCIDLEVWCTERGYSLRRQYGAGMVAADDTNLQVWKTTFVYDTYSAIVLLLDGVGYIWRRRRHAKLIPTNVKKRREAWKKSSENKPAPTYTGEGSESN